MQQDGYSHRPVEGLPASLVAPEGKTFSVVALMQRQAGLNRDLRREFVNGAKVVGTHQGAKLAQSEMAMVSYYMSSKERFGSFWRAARKLSTGNGPAGAKSFALAVDVQLLNAYEPGWPSIPLDEAVLTVSCPEWPSLRARIKEITGDDFKHLPLGVFMLWPRLLDDLTRWDGLDNTHQQAVTHAIFSMSSISRSDWFLRQGLTCCPALEPELGRLVKQPNGTAATPEGQGVRDPLGPIADPQMNGAPQWHELWPSLVSRLDSLCDELRKRPNKGAISSLVQLSEEFECLAAKMPDEKAPELADYEGKVVALLDYCRHLGQEAGFDWLLGDGLLEQIEARWHTAQRLAEVNERLAELSVEATTANKRCRDAAEQYRTAVMERAEAEAQVDAARTELTAARSLAERRLAERRKTEHQQYLLNAEAALPTLQDALLAAASPDSAPFDHQVDYRLEAQEPSLAAATIDAGEQDNRSSAPGAGDEVVPLNPTEPPSGVVAAESTVNDEQETAGTAIATLAVKVVHGGGNTTETSDAVGVRNPSPGTTARVEPALVSEASPPPAAIQLDSDDQTYSAEAGEACRPIWTLLKQGHFSLAYQMARVMADENKALKLPSPELLASVALAHHLVLPDGSVQEALADNLAKLSAELFVEEAPRAWQTALNLLLVASTLRPMILVPGTGASSIAGYLHLDARYSALYSLVQRLRHFSERLQGFRIEPTTLKLARSEAGMQNELKALERDAQDWLTVQAPAVTIKFAAATNVWRQWLKPQGVVSQLVSPVVSNRQSELQRVKELIASVSDGSDFQKLVRDTDRRGLKRTKGEDIHSGALEHLERCAAGAVALARRWVTLIEVHNQSGDRMRTLLQEVRAELSGQMAAVERELQGDDGQDAWGLIAAAQSVVLTELWAMWGLFDPAAKLPPAEPAAREVLGRELLFVPQIRLGDDWSVGTEGHAAIAAITAWARDPQDWRAAFEVRLREGDLHGAELIVQAQEDVATGQGWQSELRRERESWRGALRRAIDEARREVEVGSAYGYLTDSDRGAIESDLVRWEAQIDQLRRFDEAMGAVASVRHTVQRNRDERTAAVQLSLSELNRSLENETGVAEIDKVLAQGDIATAHELLQRLAAGLPAWPEDDRLPDKFAEFFPDAMQSLDAWLDAQRSRNAVEAAIKQGQNVPSLDFRRVAGAQRDQAAGMYSAWSDLKSRKQAESDRLETLLTGLGFTVQRLRAPERHPGREIWSLDAMSLEDRNVCPIPQFGSSARGKYRLVCVWERPTEDDILQLVGDSTLQRATIVLYFGRMTERKWRETCRLAKAKRKGFLLIDEVMLVHLCAQAGSRLSALFDLALPLAYSTPYDATAGLVPPEMFYGRSAELDAVCGLNGRCFIYGGRQLGKTALLRRAEQSFHSATERRYSRWIDLRAEGIGVSRAASDLWVCLTEQLKSIEVLDASVAVPTPSKKGSVEAVVSDLRRFLGDDSDRRVLLLLDEADRFFEQDGRNDFAETRRLKQLMDDTGRRFKVVFAGLHNVLRMTERANHPLAHFGEPIKIGPLVDEHEVREAEDLVRRPMAAAGFEFESRSLAIRILAQTNYYPSLIQLYCSHLLRHMLSKFGGVQRPAGPRYRITDRDIESVYSSGALRDEIRAKFRLTLQLDSRYEVVAYALALDALRGRFAHNEGMDWQNLRQAGAMYWWPEGFRETSELDFRVLLDEMVELGVLSRVRDGRYTLRNPNVLLLLGSQEEIEAVLVKDREPTVEFESAVFRPPLRSAPASPRRNPLTYQQLSELLRRANTVTAVAGSHAGGVLDLVAGLQDYLGQGGSLALLDGCADRAAFVRSLDQVLKNRTTDGVTVMLVPSTVPWSALWVQDAEQKLATLRSDSKFVSLVFVADPLTLWGAIGDDATFSGMDVPWMSLLPWRDEFVRHWLEEQQLPNDADLRKQVWLVTGFWSGLLQDLVAHCTEARELKRRVEAADLRTASVETVGRYAADLGLSFHEPQRVLKTLALWGDPVEPAELAALAECDLSEVQRVLRWADLLGLARREGGDFWSLDPLVKAIFQKLGD